MTTNVATRHKTWKIDVEFDETDDETCAKALLVVGGESVGGWGRARRRSNDPRVPRIGEELAAARALGDLAHRLLEVAAVEIEQFSSEPVHVHG
jgi:hypothetical protein